MKTHSKTSLTATAVVGALSLGLMAATPAAAQSYRDRDDDDRTQNALIGAAVGALAGAALGNGDGTYIAGGALAGAALGAVASDDDDDCGYYRGGRCYRNQGHWEREHGIDRNAYDSRYSYGYDDRYVDGRSYAGRGYYRDGRFWRNHGEWRSYQNRNRDYRYDRRW